MSQKSPESCPKEQGTQEEKRPLFTKSKVLIAFLLVAVGLLLAIYVFPHLSQEKIEAKLHEVGAWAGPLYTLLFAILPGFFLPVIFLVFPAGAIFGLWQGIFYTLLGASINMAWMFLVSRYLLQDQVSYFLSKKLSPEWQDRIHKHSQGRGAFFFLFVLRVSPFVPYNLINYAYGITGMKLGDYMLSSILGILPGTVVLLNLGNNIFDVGSPGFWGAIGLFILLAIISSLIAKPLTKSESPDSLPSELTEVQDRESKA